MFHEKNLLADSWSVKANAVDSNRDAVAPRRSAGSSLARRPPTVWLTGLSGAGKTTLAFALENRLLAMGHACHVLDGDRVRHGLNQDLGFSPADRSENIRRVAEVARLFNDAGMMAIVALISPQREDRKNAEGIVGPDCFLEVHVATPLTVCEARDPKGMYCRARAGLLRNFTGVDAPYEVPLDPALSVDTARLSVEECVASLLELLLPKTVHGNEPGLVRPADI